jgi:hypothetical protein
VPRVVPTPDALDGASARFSGNFPCVAVDVAPGSGRASASAPIPISALRTGPLDRFEVDLRFGKFNLRETDLLLKDADFEVPFTRSDTSWPWFGISELNAFGRFSTHDLDIAPVATRNPYTELLIVLPDADFLYFSRISRGTGCADAVYQHSETSSRFYGAVTSWNGDGAHMTHQFAALCKMMATKYQIVKDLGMTNPLPSTITFLE